ncbi:MAG TPA: hypothetical protein VE820_07475 [Sphingomicrobium sp.]|jgi:hypothetical protein|nr:hypothetical protein [Sphingomicrobium sp.]
MPEYRLYCVNDRGNFTQVDEIEAPGDAEAIMIAKAKKKPVKCELWEHGRKVATLDAHKG